MGGRPALAAESGGVAGQIERRDDRLMLGLAPLLGRDEPHHFELDAVGIVGVQALVDAVVGRALERTGLGEALAVRFEVVEGRHLPGEVVQPDRHVSRSGVAGILTDREARQIVVVARPRCSHEDVGA